MLLHLVAAMMLSALWFSASAARPDDPPPVFDTRPFAVAKKASIDSHKWLIVKATASWCAPCKQMDKTTWRDEKVTTWISGHAIAVVFDVDNDKALAEQFAIRAMPTMIALKDGKEFDRIVGYKSGGDFLAWLEGIDRGEKSIVAVEKAAGNRLAPKGEVDIQARMQLAGNLERDGKLDEAADEYAWIWEHALEHNPGMYGVRLSFLVSDMERLASRHAPAKLKFTALRDQAGKKLEGDQVDQEDLIDWIALNKVIHDPKATLDWYDRVRDQARWRPLITRARTDLVELLIKDKRWADVGRMSPDPVQELEQEHEFMQMLPKHDPPAGVDEHTRDLIADMPAKRLRDKAASLYAGLLAAGREADAGKVAKLARSYDGAAKMVKALVSTALDAGHPRKEHLGWIDAAKDPSLGTVRAQIESALAKAQK